MGWPHPKIMFQEHLREIKKLISLKTIKQIKLQKPKKKKKHSTYSNSPHFKMKTAFFASFNSKRIKLMPKITMSKETFLHLFNISKAKDFLTFYPKTKENFKINFFKLI
jgi:hypothetical protein